jgi:biotin carboxyl carrier protein
VAGYFLVQYLVRPTTQIGWYAALLALTAAAIVFILVRYFRGKEYLLVSLVILAGFMLGYVIANATFLAKVEARQLPQIERTDGGDGHTAILYFTHGEPPGYSAQPWIDTIREPDHAKAPFVPWLVRPIFFNTLRNKYFEASGSAHKKLHETFLKDLRRAMPEETEKGTRFYLAFLDSNPRPDAGTLDVVNARVSAAETNLAAARAILEQYDLRAPATGTLVESNLNVGELVTLGQPVAKWADLSEWYVETTDLTEIDVVNIEVGQAVEVAADTQPDESMNGTVTAIRDTYQ